jgi:hypothetical protein
LKHGYCDLRSPARALLRRDSLPRATGLAAEPAGVARLGLADRLFEQLARSWLGFARRHTPFFPFLHERGYLSGQELWLIWQGGEAVGYAVAVAGRGLLRVESMLLAGQVDPVAAVAALAEGAGTPYVQVRLDRPGDAARFAAAGAAVAAEDWGVFMVKPLAADATVEEFRHRYGVDRDRFLISYLDVT